MTCRETLSTKHQKKKIAVAQRSMERSLLNMTRKGRIRNEEIRRRIGVRYIMPRKRCRDDIGRKCGASRM